MSLDYLKSLPDSLYCKSLMNQLPKNMYNEYNTVEPFVKYAFLVADAKGYCVS